MEGENFMKEIMEQIVAAVGGVDNIKDISHCATRLRIVLKNDGLYDAEKIKSIKGVFGEIFATGQHQVIIGDDVKDVYAAFVDKYGEIKDSEKKRGIKNILSGIGDFVGAAIGPALMPMVGSGIIKAILIVLANFGVISAESSTYMLIYGAADTALYFFPILIAAGAAKKLGSNQYIAMFVAFGMMSPTLLGYVEAGTAITLFGFNVPLISYTTCAAFLPAILTAYVTAKFELLLRKVIPQVIQMIAVPTIVVFVMIPVTLLIIGPATNFLAELIAIPCSGLVKYRMIVLPLLATINAVLIMFGLHQVTFQTIFAIMLSTYGFDPIMMPSYLCTHIAIGATVIAVAIKTKDKNLKGIGFSTGIARWFANISEPAVFGVLSRNIRCMLITCVSAGIAGIWAAATNVTCYTFAGATWLTLPTFVGEQSSLWAAVITAVISTVCAFIGVKVFYKDKVEG